MSGPRPELALRVAVTALVARRSASLGGFAALRGGSERLAQGAALHARYQADAAGRDPGFQAEVRLRGTLRQRGCRVEIHGRADGVRERADGGLRVEELKTRRADAAPSPALHAACRLQVAVYAWLLAEQAGRPVEAELVWLDLADERPPRREPVEMPAAELEAQLRQALEPFVDDALREAREAPLRRRAAARVRFPHAERRPGQDVLEAAVEHALAEGEHLLVEAPTGLGKTAAVLVPALRFALETDRQVVFLTAKATQRAAALRLHAALALGAAAPAVGLAPRARLCINDAIVCHEDHCRFARDHFVKLRRGDGVSRLLAGPAASAASARELGLELEVCPHALLQEAAGRAPLVVGDYNHALSPAAALAPFTRDGEPGRVVLVLDEAHNVADRARDLFGAELAGPELRRAADDAELGGAPAHRELAHALAALAQAVESEVDEHCGAAPGAARAPLDAETLRPLREGLERALARRLAYAFATRGLGPEDAADRCGRELAHFARALEHGGDASVALAERGPGGEARLAVVCVDPAPRLARLFARCHAVVGLSATLSPVEQHREQLGLSATRTAHVAVPSPFPRAHRRVVIDPSIDTRAAARGRAVPRIARRLAALAAALPGHGLALLPSFSLLEAVAARLPAPPEGPARVLRQTPASDPAGTAAERQRLAAALGELPATPDERCLVLAVAGGALAEGVEFSGGGLCAVAVVGPCVPPPDPRRELLRQAYEERDEDGFLRAYALPGMVRVVQAAGRLVRSAEDRGVIALLGRRFLEAPYRDALPADWCDGEPEALVGDPAAVAREFFAAGGGLRPAAARRTAGPAPGAPTRAPAPEP